MDKLRKPGTWTSETAPKGTGRKKGVKAKMKETFGPRALDKLQSYLEGDGADKLIQEMEKLKGRHYAHAWQSAVEYFMPKQQRIQVEKKEEKTITVNHVLQNISIEEKTQLLHILRSIKAPQLPIQLSSEEVDKNKTSLPPSK